MSENPLARVKKGNLPAIDTPQILAAQLEEMSANAIVLSPVSQVTTIAAMHQVALSVVSINPEVDQYGNGDECYRDKRFCKGDHVAPGKVALAKICRAAGVQVVKNERVDDRSNPFYCHIQMTLGMREYTGEWTQHICSKEVDLSDGSPETKKKDGTVRSDLGEMRKHMQSNCETKCLQRGLRQMLGLQQTYSAKQLKAKPFLVPKLVANLDPEDPEQKRALIAQATGAQGAIFGQPSGSQVSSITDGTGQPGPGQVVLDGATGEVVAEGAAQPGAAPEPAPEPMDPADFGDLPEPLPEPQPEPQGPEHICGCPCGCQGELTAEVAAATQKKIGTPRCKSCFPGRAFDFKMHQDVPNGLLGITHPKSGEPITVDWVKKHQAQ